MRAQTLIATLILFAALFASLNAKAAATMKMQCEFEPNILGDVLELNFTIYSSDLVSWKLSDDSTMLTRTTIPHVFTDTMSKWGMSSARKTETGIEISGTQVNRMLGLESEKKLVIDLQEMSAVLRQSIRSYSKLPENSAPLFQVVEGRCR